MSSWRRGLIGSGTTLLAALLVLGQPAVRADTSVTPDPDPRARYAHDVVSVRVDNTGDRVGVRVRHRAAPWSGRVTIEIDAHGGSRWDAVASTGRGGRGHLTTRSGRRLGCPWEIRSRRGDPRTVLTATRDCLFGADHLRVRVTSHVAGLPDDVAVSERTPQQGRPNIVLIQADDMRADELDGPWMEYTRRLLADRGVRFVNSVAPLPLCCPARASLLTGQYPHNHEVWTHADPYGFHALNDRQTLPVWLDKAGYRTVFLGKYLNRYGKQEPYDGDDEPPEWDNSSATYVPPGWDDWRGSYKGTHHYRNTHLNVNGEDQSLRGRYQTRAFGDISSNLIRRYSRSASPFFMYVSFLAPHHGLPRDPDDPPVVTDDSENIRRISTPYVPTDSRDLFDGLIPAIPGAEGEQDMSDKPTFMQGLTAMNQREVDSVLESTRQRAEAEAVMDQQVRRMVQTLRRAGELDDTYVMFTSDNGYLLGEHRIRQGKTLPYEPSLRVPMVVRGPGIPAGEVRYDPFVTIDWAPTVLAMAGAKASRRTNGVPSLDGVNMLPVAEDGDRGWNRAVGTESGVKDNDSISGHQRGIRTSRYLYTEYNNGVRELYDLRIDPDQVCNLLAKGWRSSPDCAGIGDPGRVRRVARALSELRDRLDPKVGPGCAGRECRRLVLPRFLRSQPGRTPGPPPADWFVRGR